MSTPPSAVRVSGLPPGTDKGAVMDFFTRVGDVAEVTMLSEPSDNSVALVTFQNAADVSEALHMSGVAFTDGSLLTVTAASASADDKAAGDTATAEREKPDRDANKVAVRNFAPGTTEGQLRDFFAGCGLVTDVYVSPSRNRHFAFVGFADNNGVEAALSKNGQTLNGVAVDVERKRRINHDNRLVVSELPADITEDALRGFFASADCTVADMHLDAAKGVAYVNVNTAEEVERAVSKSGEQICGSAVSIVAKPRVCPLCNRPGHQPAQCPDRRAGGSGAGRGGAAGGRGSFRGGTYRGAGGGSSVVCHACGKVGHIARDCRSNVRDVRDVRDVRRRRDDSVDRDNSRDGGRRYRRRDDSRERRRSRSRSYDRERRDRDRRRRHSSSSTPPRRRRRDDSRERRRSRSRSRSPRDRK